MPHDAIVRQRGGNGGEYTKHIYMGGQRITSKVSNSGIFASSPVTTTEQQAKYTAQTAALKGRYDSLGVSYKGVSQSGNLVSQNPSTTASSYFYHSDHLGSSSLITDQSGAMVQHMEYVPYGETFIDERRSASSWTTPYQFSGKERDEETGLLYFGARYQDSKYGIWYSVDPLAEKYPNLSSYVYCLDNPLKFVDPDGRDNFEVSKSREGKVQINVVRTDDKTNTYNFVEADGTKRDLGTYDKQNNMVKLKENTDFYEQTNYSQGKNYINGDEAAGLLGAMYQYNQETGNKAYISQLNNSDGGHSAHEGKGTNADLKYANLNGNKPNEAVWTNAPNFDKKNSQKLVNYLVEFGFNRPNGKYSILTENAKGNGPALNNTNFVDGSKNKPPFHHKHHMHLQQFNKSIINVINTNK